MSPADRRAGSGTVPRRSPMVALNQVLVTVAGVAVVAAIGSSSSPLVVLRATEVAVFVVAFSGLHILSGHLGLISVGHGAFIGIGAVTAAHAIDDASLPYLLAPVAGAFGGALFGVIIGIPSLRLPGAYLALLTLAVAMVLPIGLRRIDGPLGYPVDADFVPPAWTGLSPADTELWQFAMVVVVGALIMIVVHGAVRGRFARSLIAVRDNPTAAAAFGVNVSIVHLAGVAVSAALAGAAGGLLLYATPLVAGDQYPFSLSVAMFALMLALGASQLWTSVPASLILVLVPEILTRVGKAAWEPILYAAILLVMTRVSRGRGIISLLERSQQPIARPRPSAPSRSTDNPASTPAAAGSIDHGSDGDGSDRHPVPANPWLLTPEPSNEPTERG
jgi:branched-chain amino acid transport system permease protein